MKKLCLGIITGEANKSRSGKVTKAPGTHTIPFSSSLGTTDYSLHVTVIQDSVEMFNGYINPITSAAGFDITIEGTADATIIYNATKYQ